MRKSRLRRFKLFGLSIQVFSWLLQLSNTCRWKTSNICALSIVSISILIFIKYADLNLHDSREKLRINRKLIELIEKLQINRYILSLYNRILLNFQFSTLN